MEKTTIRRIERTIIKKVRKMKNLIENAVKLFNKEKEIFYFPNNKNVAITNNQKNNIEGFYLENKFAQCGLEDEIDLSNKKRLFFHIQNDEFVILEIKFYKIENSYNYSKKYYFKGRIYNRKLTEKQNKRVKLLYVYSTKIFCMNYDSCKNKMCLNKYSKDIEKFTKENKLPLHLKAYTDCLKNN